MLGLIKKDILMIKSNFKVFGILLIFYIIMAFNGQMDLSFLLPFMSIMIMISTFSYDEYNKWNAYACTLPNGRKNVVLAKYLSTLIMIIITTIIITISSIIISYTRTKIINYDEIFGTILGVTFATVLLEAIFYPSIYKFGVEKSRIGIFVVIFGTSIVIGLLSRVVNFGHFLKILKPLENYVLILIPVLMIIMLYTSYKISKRINLKKEF